MTVTVRRGGHGPVIDEEGVLCHPPIGRAGPGDRQPVRLLLVDPDPHIRVALRSIIEADPLVVVVGEAEDGPAATRLASTLEPDIILMDLILPNGGLAATREILALKTEATVLIFSLHDDRHLADEAIAAGAAGYLLTSDASAELIEAVRTVASGGSYVSCALR